MKSDAQGGIRIEWKRDKAAVRLIVPAEEGGKTYIYHEFDNIPGSDRGVTGSRLAFWLKQLG